MHKIGKGAASLLAASALAVSATVSTEVPASAASERQTTSTSYSYADLGAASPGTARAQRKLPPKVTANGVADEAFAPAASSGSRNSKGKKALAFAKRQLGDRYRYGASGPNSWDCSGLTQGAWRKAGVKLPHSSRAQFRRGKKVSRSNLRKGDLVFFYSRPSHVGIYAGNGKIIHASRPGKPVGYAKISSMPYKGARRVR